MYHVWRIVFPGWSNSTSACDVVCIHVPYQRGVTRPVLGGAPQESFLGSTHSTSPATSWHSGILAQLATSLGQQILGGRPMVGVGGAQTRNIGPAGSGRAV